MPRVLDIELIGYTIFLSFLGSVRWSDGGFWHGIWFFLIAAWCFGYFIYRRRKEKREKIEKERRKKEREKQAL